MKKGRSFIGFYFGLFLLFAGILCFGKETQAKGIERNFVLYTGMSIRIEEKEVSGLTEENESQEILYENEDICAVDESTIHDDEYSSFLTIEGKKEGTAQIQILEHRELGDEVFVTYNIEVKKAPSDAVPIKDPMINAILTGQYESTFWAYSCDENKDGYVSFEELKKVKAFYFAPARGDSYSITDLSGMEYAENTEEMYLYGNSRLEDVTPLKNLKSLQILGLKKTNVSARDRWELADFQDMEIEIGSIIVLPLVQSIFEEGDLEINILQGDCVRIDKGNLEMGNYVAAALDFGSVQIEINYKEYSKKINVEVTGISPDQKIGKKYANKPNLITIPKIVETVEVNVSYQGAVETAILKDNGELWQIYPETRKIDEKIKAYKAGYVYNNWNETDQNKEEGADIYRYRLNQQGELWSGEQKIAENVVDFNERYALQKDGTLVNTYNKVKENIAGVKDWITYEKAETVSGWHRSCSYYTVVLKKDNTIWIREEVESDQTVHTFEKLDENVKQLVSRGYMRSDGTAYDFRRMETLEEKCEYITEAGYYGTNGYFYTWDRNEAMSTLRIVDMISRLYADTYQYLALTDNGQLWRIKEIPVTAFEYDIEEEYVTDQFLTFNEILYTANEYYVPGTWSYQTRDGKYYNFDGKQLAGTKETQFILNSADCNTALGSEIPRYLYQLVDDGSNDGYYIVKNGCKMLNHVTDMIRHGNKIYAVREDGTLWDVTDRPKQVIEIVANGYEKLPFLDTERGDWYWSSVDFVFQNDIMTGLNKCSFGPAQNLSRGQFATILYRMTGSPEVTYSSRFPDVPDGQFYTKPVLWASNEDVKVVNGYADGNFGPADLITREQMAVMMYRYAGHQGCDTSARADLSGYPDYKKVSDFSREAMEWAVAAGLISGNADKTLAPQGEASRAVCATIIMRFMEKF